MSAIVFAMTKNKKTGEKNMEKKNKNIKMDGIVVAEVTHNKTKYYLVKVTIPKNDNYYIVVTEYENMLTVKSAGLYAEDTVDYAIRKARERGDDDEVERYYRLLGKFELNRWNGAES